MKRNFSTVRYFVHICFRVVPDDKYDLVQNCNLANSTTARGSIQEAWSIESAMKFGTPSIETLLPVEGLTLFYGKISPVGDVFTRIVPIPVLDDEFRCSTASFSRGRAICKGLSYGNEI